MPTIFNAPTSNFVQTTLNGAITNAATTITLASTTGLQAPGYVVINRTDSAGTATPNAREVVSYTGISGSDLTGCVRPADGSTARSHADGSVVEANPTIGMWNNLATIISTAMTSDSYLKPIASPVSISAGRLITLSLESLASIARLQAREFISNSGATINDLRIVNRIDLSGVSVTGWAGLNPMWYMPGFASAASTNVMRLIMPAAGTFQFFTMMTRTPVSTASLTIDVNKNNTSIFDTVGRINILGGGTFASTASIKTKTFDSGDVFTVDIDTGGNVADITVIGRAA